MRLVRKVLALAGVALLSAYFMADAYRRAQEDAIAQLYSQERILAWQAARGISAYFANHRQSLLFLTRDQEVIQNSERGQRLLKEWYLSQSNQLLSITRVGINGRILYTHPEEQAIGRMILDQPHVKQIFATHQPVVSEVFKSVQGFPCVAYHFPIFKEGRFAGTVALLLPFEAISQEHVAGIKVGGSGYAKLVSREGIELYCAAPGHIRQSVLETSKGFPDLQAMIKRMLKGESGTASYDYGIVRENRDANVHKHAYFMPIPLENTFWSICVNAPEEEALLFIKGFRDRWILGMVLLLFSFGVWGTFLARAFLAVQRERTRREAEARVRLAEREQEKVLAESEARFRTYFEDSLVAMGICSPDQRWLAVNERFARLLGYTKDELLRLSWDHTTNPEDLRASHQEYERMLANEMEGFSREQRFVRKDKAVIHAILSVRLIRKADGAPDYCLVQLQDITGRKHAEEEKGRLEEKLRQSQKLEAVGQLAGGVAHDFNNLLTVQLGHLDLLNQITELPEEARESHAQIAQSAIMASQLTRHLLAFSRQQVLQIRRLDLNEVLDHLIKMLRRLLREDISLELKMARAPLWLDADASMVEQVIMNLVVNARDAMPSGGRLTLSTEMIELSEKSPLPHPEARPGSFVCLVVADTGQGMNAQTRERIFEPFFTTKGPGKGTGLGLATVYGIVKQHHGWIEVESAENQGSVFRIYYPAAAAPEPGNAELPADTISNLRGNGETVLLVEDNPIVSKTLATSLERLNYHVLSAAHSQEALHLWRQKREQIHVLLTDMVMPNGANGLELAAQLRAERPLLPVIVVSGYSQELVADGLGADMLFLPKPCALVALGKTLRQSLNPRPAPPGGS